ncbi:MAG TPA: NBR1-Ig-like domain-containing protein, partial [Anaerolineales bacterium]|nr:NBR1-Ig-like domain-containing protein [Anaerolineales bacterium]
VLIITTLVSACSNPSPDQPAPGEGFRPPTQAVSPTAPPATPVILVTATPDGSIFHPTATPSCSDSLTFLEDLTVPDGTPVTPGAVLDKRWQVQNSGTCNWDAGYTIQRTAGPELGAPQNLALYPARSGGEATLRIEFIAPNEAGTYRSAWQAYNPNSVAFGDPFFIEFVVSP